TGTVPSTSFDALGRTPWPARTVRSQRPSCAFLECLGIGLDVCPAHREQRQAAIRTPPDERTQIQRLGGASRAPIASQEAGQGQRVRGGEGGSVDDHRRGRFVLYGYLPSRCDSRAPSPTFERRKGLFGEIELAFRLRQRLCC